MFQLKDHEIGGGIARRVFTSGGKQVAPGSNISAEEILRMPKANRNALINKRYIEIYPKGINSVASPSPGLGGNAERFVVSMGFGKFTVIEGRRVSDTPLDREQAYALAGQAMPIGKPSRAKKSKAVVEA